MTLRLKHKHMLAISLFVGCIIVLSALLIQSIDTRMNQALREREGLRVISPTLETMVAIQQARLSETAARAGFDTLSATTLRRDDASLESALAYYQEKAGAPSPALLRAIDDMKESSAPLEVQNLHRMLWQLSADSKLTLDSEPASSTLATILTRLLPRMVHDFDMDNALWHDLVESTATGDGRFLLHAHSIQQQSEHMLYLLRTALKSKESPLYQHPDLQRSYSHFTKVSAAYSKALSNVSLNITPKKFARTIGNAMDYLRALHETQIAISAALESLLNTRIAALEEEQQITVLFPVGALLLACILYFCITNSIVQPLMRVKDRMYAMANWELEHPIPGRNRRDEFGEMAFALEVYRQNARRFKELEDMEAALERARAERQQKLEALIEAFEARTISVIETVASAAEQLHGTAEHMMHSVAIAQRNTSQVAHSMGSSTSQIHAIAESSDTIHHAIMDMVRQIQHAATLSRSSLEETQDADNSTRELAEATRSISGVIQLIRKITEKINLLALNAGIESIRAGEAGKGFVVVAQEVKTLATQTKRATEDIVDKIYLLQEKTAVTENALKMVRDGMAQVAENNQTLHHGIQEQQKLTNGIAYNMQHASEVMQKMDDNVSTIHQQITEIDVASKHVIDASRQLNSQANILSHEVKKFLRDIAQVEELPADHAPLQLVDKAA